MARTTEEDVRDLIDNDSSISVDPFIEIANLLVSRVSTCANAKGQSLNSNELRVLESLLAAHFYSRRDPLYQEKMTEKASAVFQGMTGMRLDSTYYGQDAILLDTSGCLAKLNRGANASISWLGKPKSDQIAIEDRD